MYCLASCFLYTATATTEFYTLSLHDALPIWFFISSHSLAAHERTLRALSTHTTADLKRPGTAGRVRVDGLLAAMQRSEEHTSELQSHVNLVCRLLLEKKKKVQLRKDGLRVPA